MDALARLLILGGVASADNLSGSCILFQTEYQKTLTKTLIDVGLFQGGRFNETHEKNMGIIYKFDPDSIDSMVITHGHLDHMGNAPRLSRYGFNGTIYCTQPTAKIMPISLADTAKIQAEETRYRRQKANKNTRDHATHSSNTWRGNRDRYRNNEKLKRAKERKVINPLDEPLYSLADVEQCTSLITGSGQGARYHTWIKLAKHLHLKMIPSGHVLGGAICVLRTKTREGFMNIGFSGDLGGPGIILPPPGMVEEQLDYWVTESTRAGKSYPSRDMEISKLFELICKTFYEEGRIIIPAFALERTQEIIFLLSKAIYEGVLPNIPIYLDAPLAEKHTQVFSEYWRGDTGLFKNQNDLPFNPFCSKENRNLHLVISPDESAKLAASKEPAIIISGSGNCDAGRVRRLLRAELGNPNSAICIVGYMPENSLGRKLKEGATTVNMNKEPIIVRAKVASFENFSGHADEKELCDYAGTIANKDNPFFKKVIIVHGEKDGSQALKKRMIRDLSIKGEQILIPHIGDTINLL